MTISAAGIDAGKTFLDVALAPKAVTFRVPNSRDGIKTILARLARAGIRHIVLEAIGSYAAPLVQALVARGFAVGVVNPKRIKAFREAEGKRAKNDRLDARLIARFALVMTDAIRPLPSQDQLAIKALATRRRQLVEMIAMEKTRLKQAPNSLIADSHRAAIASLAGVAPHIQQSGATPGRAQIGGGRPCVRAALYMAALSAARYHPAFHAPYQIMRSDGKPAKVALVAVARKLVTIANALAKTNQLFQQNPNAPT